MGYRQLTQAQRYQISALLTVGRSQRQIADTLGCHNTTVNREIRRNSDAMGYDPVRLIAVANGGARQPKRRISERHY